MVDILRLHRIMKGGDVMNNSRRRRLTEIQERIQDIMADLNEEVRAYAGR